MGHGDPRISVVIPTRNRSAKLQRCLEAIVAQSMEGIEIVVCDDASTDDTPEMLDRFAEMHPDVRLVRVRSDPQIGANPSRNRGIEAGRGELVAFLDDDCAPKAGWAAALVAPFDDQIVGATTGIVEDVPARNLFEMTFKGTHRVWSPDGRRASRLAGANMCVRRRLLEDHGLDEDRARPSADVSVSGRGDEDGLAVRLRRAGHDLVLAPDARVEHDHPMSGRTFFRQAWRSGGAAARYVYKYRLAMGLDLAPLLMGWVALLLALVNAWMLVPASLAFAAALLAYLYNDLFRKRKTIVETVITFPLLLVYYHVRLLGFAWQYPRVWAGLDGVRRE